MWFNAEVFIFIVQKYIDNLAQGYIISIARAMDIIQHYSK